MNAQRIEDLLAGRWLNLAGLVLVFLGTVFFLKVAFDHNWILPVFRVLLGVAAGGAAIAYAQLIAHKERPYFAEGLTALGTGIEFLSLYASNALYHLLNSEMSLAGMLVVTVLVALIARSNRSVRLATLAALGGYLAPILTGTPNTSLWLLAGYLTILNAGIMVLSEVLDAPWIGALAAGSSFFYAYAVFYPSTQLDAAQHAIVYGMLYAAFCVAGWAASRKVSELEPVRASITIVTQLALIAGLESSLGSQRYDLAIALVILATAHFAAGITRKSRVHYWLAAAAITPAVPAALNDSWVDATWALEATILAIAGRRRDDAVLQIGSLALLVVAVGVNLERTYWFATQTPIFNPRFASAATMCAAAFTIAYDAVRNGINEYDATIARPLRIGAHALALLAISREAWDSALYFHATTQAANVALSVAWAAFAVAFVASGFVKRDALLRWEGLGLLTATTLKVTLVDLSFLDIGYRIVPAILVGLALIGTSYFYQRRMP